MKQPINRRCPYCGTTFTTSRRLKAYCDMLCQMRAKAERHARSPRRREWFRAYRMARRQEAAA